MHWKAIRPETDSGLQSLLCFTVGPEPMLHLSLKAIPHFLWPLLHLSVQVKSSSCKIQTLVPPEVPQRWRYCKDWTRPQEFLFGPVLHSTTKPAHDRHSSFLGCFSIASSWAESGISEFKNELSEPFTAREDELWVGFLRDKYKLVYNFDFYQVKICNMKGQGDR